jgi:beta-glucanase (GH16 family)
MRKAVKIEALENLLPNSLLLTGAHARTWTSADGAKTFEGELRSYDPATGALSVTLTGGKEMKFSHDKLSAADIAFLKEQGKVDAASAEKPGPPLEGKWKSIPELTDEFEGRALDAKKWHDHNPGWKGREPGFFSPKNVSVSDGKLHLTSRVETLPDLPKGFHTFTTAAVKSKALVKYGYFEMKCRPMKSQATSAFWFYNSTPEEWTEIDVFEICGAGGKWNNSYNMTLHVFHSPTEKKHWQKGKRWDPPFVMADDYHVYALEWNKDVIKWWVDGKVVHEMKNTHWHQPLNMNFDSETMPDWFGLPDKASLPATFSIEYIRSWREEQATK